MYRISNNYRTRRDNMKLVKVSEVEGRIIKEYDNGMVIKEAISNEEEEVKEPQINPIDQVQNDLNFIVLKLKGLI